MNMLSRCFQEAKESTALTEGCGIKVNGFRLEHK